MTFLVIDRKWCYFFCFYFNFPPHPPLFLYFFVIHHCKNSLSPLHVFVHHCTLKQALLIGYIDLNLQPLGNVPNRLPFAIPADRKAPWSRHIHAYISVGFQHWYSITPKIL